MKKKPTSTFQKLRIFFFFLSTAVIAENRIKDSSLLLGDSHINRALWSSVVNVQIEVCTNTLCTEMFMPALFIIEGN